MPTVQKLSHAMVEEYLRTMGYKFLRDSEGDYRVDFSYDEQLDCKISYYMLIDGQNRNIYTVRVYSDKRVPRNDWPRFLFLVNEWNKDKRWPKAYLYIRDPQTSPSGEVILEQQMDFEQGIHQELLNDFTNTTLAGAYAFWGWITEVQSGGPGA
ncbi:MAG: hypothetical protein OHK0015_38500 [Chloroflexi bacterium OHK40]